MQGYPQSPVTSAPRVATQTRRFFNMVIDYSLIQVIATLTVLPWLTELLNRSAFSEKLSSFQVETIIQILPTILVPVLLITYFIICEASWQTTIGKLITHTKVVNMTGGRPTFGQVVGRSFARYIPFEPFSFLNGTYPRGWHDTLTGTMVVSADYTTAEIQAIDMTNVQPDSKLAVRLLVGFIAFIAIGMFLIFALPSLGGTLSNLKNYETASGNNTATTTEEAKGTFMNNRFTTPEGEASVYMPFKPKVETEKGLPVEASDIVYDSYQYSAERKSVYYLFSRYLYHPQLGVRLPEEYLRDFVGIMTESIEGGKLVSSTYSLENLVPVLRFKVSYDEYLIDGKIFLYEDNPYVLTAEYNSEIKDVSEIETFLSSMIFK